MIQDKKKVLFILPSLGFGGIEKSLIELAESLLESKHEVYIGLIQKKGVFLELLPKGVHLFEIKGLNEIWQQVNDPPLLYIKKLIRTRRILSAMIYTGLHSLYKITGSRYWFYRYVLRKEPINSQVFDIAVAYFSIPVIIDFYICEKVKAKEKYGWIHVDVSNAYFDKCLIHRLYPQYKKIFVVSEEARTRFLNRFPQFREKTEVRYNIIPKEKIRKMAMEGEGFEDHQDSIIRILTVGRICNNVKGQLLAIESMKLLRRKGYGIKWYFVGDGVDLQRDRQIIKEEGLDDYVCFLGFRLNPYGFMKGCDIYVQPSLQEGYCITLAEALVFNHPTVATGFAGAEEQLRNRTNGFITDFSAQSLAAGIEKAIESIST